MEYFNFPPTTGIGALRQTSWDMYFWEERKIYERNHFLIYLILAKLIKLKLSYYVS